MQTLTHGVVTGDFLPGDFDSAIFVAPKRIHVYGMTTIYGSLCRETVLCERHIGQDGPWNLQPEDCDDPTRHDVTLTPGAFCIVCGEPWL